MISYVNCDYKVLITGANGFIGSTLYSLLDKKGVYVRGTFRKANCFGKLSNHLINNLQDDRFSIIDGFEKNEKWEYALKDIDVVVHLAALVHQMNVNEESIADKYFKINTTGTINIAEMAVNVGVRRFIFLSTVKVHGEKNIDNTPFHETDEPVPEEPYSVSKLEAEKYLLSLSIKTGMEVIIIRPPLVYGPKGEKGNFVRMMKIINMGIPLPFGDIKNKRSIIFIDNLIEAIFYCIFHTKIGNKVFLISDGIDVSTPDIFQYIADAMGKKLKLISVPIPILRSIGGILGKSKEISRLTNSLYVDSSLIRATFNWTPTYSTNDGIKQTVDALKKSL